MDLEKQRRIERQAYLFWEAEGQPHGRHEEHWHRAARQIEADEKVHIARKAQKGEGPGASRREAGARKVKEIMRRPRRRELARFL